MKNLHLLYTDKLSRLFYLGSNLHLEQGQLIAPKNYQHIYITSDEEIKEGDWCLDIKRNIIFQSKRNEIGTSKKIPIIICTYEGCYIQKDCKKIILTTNADLIDEGIQAIDDEFLEWFVKNPSCEEVEVQKWFDGVDFLEYKIIISKEEPKQEMLEDYYIGKTLKVKNKIPSRYYESILQESETIKIDKFIDGAVEGCRVAIGYKNGFEYLLFNTAYVDSYLQSAFELIDESIIPKQETFERAKSTLRKHLFDNKAKLARDLEQMREWSNANKQETLEEAAERYLESKNWRNIGSFNQLQNIFTEGAKWQAERMCSEEEVVQLLIKFNQEIQEVEDVRGWFEEFKKN